MPKGPKGEKRPADAIGAAITVAKIATGEAEDDVADDGKNKTAQELGRLGGRRRGQTGQRRYAYRRTSALKDGGTRPNRPSVLRTNQTGRRRKPPSGPAHKAGPHVRRTLLAHGLTLYRKEPCRNTCPPVGI